MSVTTSGTVCPYTVMSGPKGITANISRAVMATTAGASRKMTRSAASGTMSSLVIILIVSAKGWSRPYRPARFGP